MWVVGNEPKGRVVMVMPDFVQLWWDKSGYFDGCFMILLYNLSLSILKTIKYHLLGLP